MQWGSRNGHTQIAHQFPSPIVHNYAYDNASRVVNFVSTGEFFGPDDRRYQYDDAGQLRAMTSIDPLSGDFYEYDDNGNRVGTKDYLPDAFVPWVVAPSNRLLDDGTYTYAYDAVGTLTIRTLKADPTRWTLYQWDARNRLVGIIERDNGVVIEELYYSYDAQDRRVKRTDYGAPPTYEYFVYDGDELAMTFGATGSASPVLEHRYLHGPANLKLVDEAFNAAGESADVLWLLGDHQNSVRDVVDDNGILRKHIDYDSFGQITGEQFYANNGSPISATHAEAVDQLLAYTGQERDSATGLQQHGHDPGRWYDPRIGRWLSEDPIGFDAGDPNLYRYVGNGVTYRTDPTGLRQAGNPLDNLSGALGGGYRAGAVQTPKPINPALTSAKAPTYYSPLPTVNSSPVASTVGGVSSQINQLLNPTPSAKDFARATPLPTYDYYNSLARPTAPTREQLYQAELNPHGRPVSVQTIVSPTYGNIFRSPSAKLQNVIQTTNSPLAAGAAQLVKPIVSSVGHVAGGLVDAALPPSDPRHIVTYSNGARGLYLGEGPTTGGLTGQALLLAPPILSGTSRAAGQLVLRTNGNPSTIAPSTVPRQGIYEFPDAGAGGTPYVGQSGNISQRLQQHVQAGRLTEGTVPRTTEVVGGKTAREIAEHQRIQELTGGVPARLSPNVSNQRDPIGPLRRHLLGDQ